VTPSVEPPESGENSNRRPAALKATGRNRAIFRVESSVCANEKRSFPLLSSSSRIAKPAVFAEVQSVPALFGLSRQTQPGAFSSLTPLTSWALTVTHWIAIKILAPTRNRFVLFIVFTRPPHGVATGITIYDTFHGTRVSKKSAQR
jgi:hypothetical protein